MTNTSGTSITEAHLASSRANMRDLDITFTPQSILVTQTGQRRCTYTVTMARSIIAFISSSNPTAAFGHYSRGNLDPPDNLIGALGWVAGMADNWGYAAEKYHIGTGQCLPQDDEAACCELLKHWGHDLHEHLSNLDEGLVALDEYDLLGHPNPDPTNPHYEAQIDKAMELLEEHGSKYIKPRIERWNEDWPCETAQECDALFYGLYDDGHSHGSYLPHQMTDALALAEAITSIVDQLKAQDVLHLNWLKVEVRDVKMSTVQIETPPWMAGIYDGQEELKAKIQQAIDTPPTEVSDNRRLIVIKPAINARAVVSTLEHQQRQERQFYEEVISKLTRIIKMAEERTNAATCAELTPVLDSTQARLKQLTQDMALTTLATALDGCVMDGIHEAINLVPESASMSDDDVASGLAWLDACLNSAGSKIEDLKVKLTQVEVVNKNLIRERDELAAKLQATQDEDAVEVEVVEPAQQVLDALRHAVAVIKDNPPTQDRPRPNVRITTEVHKILGGIGLHGYHIQINPPKLDDQIEQTLEHVHRLDALLCDTLQEMWRTSPANLHLGDANIVRNTEGTVMVAVPSKRRFY